jgi:ubiquinone/menaquinone biosynthesis C-methylase UbiE
MKDSSVYSLFDRPWLYALVQRTMALDAHERLSRKIAEVLSEFPPARRVLDVGCGPASWLWREGLHPFGLDISHSYARAYMVKGDQSVTGSASAIPFASRSFDAVWSIGILHHLPDDILVRSVKEMQRVVKLDGYCAIFDAVMPLSAWRRPIAYALRRIDRGRYIRQQAGLEALLNSCGEWRCERISYALTGLEGIMCIATNLLTRLPKPE